MTHYPSFKTAFSETYLFMALSIYLSMTLTFYLSDLKVKINIAPDLDVKMSVSPDLEVPVNVSHLIWRFQ